MVIVEFPIYFLPVQFTGERVEHMHLSIAEAQHDTQLTPEESTWKERPNPASSGIRYMLSQHGKSIRNSWPLPSSTEKSLDCELGSSEGCKKVRFTYVGHRQRSGMWFMVCMDHHTVVGYHVIRHGEGRRDVFYPIYRFKETPPKAIFGDYVCGVEETCMNYLPEYFSSSLFFHDIFHGCKHICSDRFCSRRLASYAVLNTSLMEQVFLKSECVSCYSFVEIHGRFYVCF